MPTVGFLIYCAAVIAAFPLYLTLPLCLVQSVRPEAEHSDRGAKIYDLRLPRSRTTSQQRLAHMFVRRLWFDVNIYPLLPLLPTWDGRALAVNDRKRWILWRLAQLIRGIPHAIGRWILGTRHSRGLDRVRQYAVVLFHFLYVVFALRHPR